MPNLRERLVASTTRRYPLMSGRGTIANSRLMSALAGPPSDEWAWGKSPGGPIWLRLDDYVGRAVFFLGDLDPKITKICRRLLKPGDTALDIGANIGLVTLEMSRLVGSSGRVLAFEPQPKMQGAIDTSVRESGRGNVQLHRCALGSKDDVLPLMVPSGNAGAASMLKPHGYDIKELIRVPVRRLDDVLQEAGVESVRLVKIDVEGFEPEVLAGAPKFISERRADAIVFELNGRTQKLVRDEPVIATLSQAGYAIFEIKKTLLRLRVERVALSNQTELAGHDLIALADDARLRGLVDCLG